ncbi:hypothetical protein [Streptomyces atacamensis]
MLSETESGQVPGGEVIARYARALGGSLTAVAVFDDGDLGKVG